MKCTIRGTKCIDQIYLILQSGNALGAKKQSDYPWFVVFIPRGVTAFAVLVGRLKKQSQKLVNQKVLLLLG